MDFLLAGTGRTQVASVLQENGIKTAHADGYRPVAAGGTRPARHGLPTPGRRSTFKHNYVGGGN
jgi:hypothetical protein